MKEFAWLPLVTWLALTVSVQGQAPVTVEKYNELIPQNLLRLVHAPEVHRELALSSEQVADLENFFEQVDGDWFRSRILPVDKQQKLMAELESRLRTWLIKHVSDDQRTRLQQLEYRSLGLRMLLRRDVAQQIDMSDSQQAEFAALAQAASAALAEAQQAGLNGEIPEELKSAALTATQAEQAALNSLLSPEQRMRLGKILGESFDTAKLERIYPMAPEFVPVEHWLNSPPLKLKDLRGKVVVVHFYAFQCHNCHANFGHYNKWHSEFPRDQVVLIGIQTPETSSERDPAAVRAAAKDRGFQFPVIVDLQSENWKAWSNTMWPTVYVVDKQGYIRYLWQGELNWKGATHDRTIHDLIEKLVKEVDL